MAFRTIRNLFIYPIKACGGIEVDAALVKEKGFDLDRRMMLVDEEGIFITQRECPQLSRVSTRIEDRNIIAEYEGQALIIDAKAALETGTATVRVWKDEVQHNIRHDHAAQFFSDIIGRPCALVQSSDKSQRVKILAKDPHTTALSFADGYPYHILGTASLKDLNNRLETPVEMHRFRPNIVVETSTPYEEDTWEDVRIGRLNFRVIKPCARCIVVNVNEATAEITKEPLRTLSTYRKINNMVNFGANAVALDTNAYIHKNEQLLIHDAKN